MPFIPAAPRLLLARRIIPVSRTAILRRHTATTAAAPPENLNKTVATASPPVDSATALAEPTPEPPADLASSAYSPVLAFPQQRNEGAALDAASASGAPLDLQARTVRIYKPSKAATQSGNWNGRQWRMDWDVLPRGYRWENGLMGWQSSGDFMQATHVFFKTKEDAIQFAEKQGYKWLIQEPNVRELKPKAYASNFVHSPNKLKIIRTK